MKKNKLFLGIILIMLLAMSTSLMAQMTLVFNTNLSTGTEVTLPLYGTVNVTVDWGDGGGTEAFTTTGNKSHTYAADGTYTVSISGSLTQFGSGNAYDNVDKLTTVSSFGNIGLTSLYGAFRNTTNLATVPTALPATITNLSRTFQYTGQTSITGLDSWVVSNVTDMSFMFANASAFNQDISGWTVSSVTSMSTMFFYATAFNQDIGNWIVSNVTDMSYMFQYASAFNQNIGGWNVSNVSNMRRMFFDASAFNQNISTWTVSAVTDMSYMFRSATAFNQNISTWTVSAVTNMSGMFCLATAFNQNIGSWDVSNVTNMSYIFYNASAFNQSIGNWNVANVSTMTNMFWGITLSTANYDALLIGWDALELYDDVNFHGGNSKYSPGTAATARANIISTDNWTITDGGEGEPLPVTLSSFTANYVNGSSLLNWTTQSESNNLGWNIYRSETKNLDETILLNTNIIDGAGTTSLPTDYSFNDEAEIITGNSYWYWLESIEYDGTSLFYEPVKIDIPLDEDEQQPPELIVDFGLAQNYPNPFNPTTKIAFMLAEGNQHNTKIMIYNSKGQVVKIFDNLDVDSSGYGSIIWDGDDSDNNVVSSGIYLYRLITPNREYSKKMILMK